MPNAIKYNVSAETLALKKGNFYIGTGDVGKGPTSSTGYYNGISPPSGGYTIYLNKESGGPSIYTVTTEAQLTGLTSTIAGQTLTTSGACLNWFATQTDKMIFNIDYPAVVTDGLILHIDSAFTPSYPQSGVTVYNLVPSQYNGTLTNGLTWSGGSFNFDGTDDVILWSSQPVTGVTNQITYNIWFNMNNTSGTQPFFSFKDSLISLANGTQWNYWWNVNAVQGTITTSAIQTGTWYNMTLTQSGSSTTLYINGVAQPSIVSGNITFQRDAKAIGWYDTSPGAQSKYNGKISLAQIYNKCLTSSEILQNYQTILPRFVGENFITNGLIFYVDAGYRTSYPESGTTFYDVSGYGNNGTLVNGVGFNSSNGGSFIFDGTDDNSYTNSNINLLPLGDNSRTMSYWIYPTKTTSQTLIQIAGYGLDNGVGNLFAGSIGSNGKSFLWANSNNYTSTHDITLNTWQQITWVKTAGNIVCYKNGVADNGGSYTINTVESRPYMGQVFNQNIYDKYQGNIGNFYIYNRALTASEILQNYNAQKGRFGL